MEVPVGQDWSLESVALDSCHTKLKKTFKNLQNVTQFYKFYVEYIEVEH